MVARPPLRVEIAAMRVEDILFGAGRPILLLPPPAAAGFEGLFAGPALIGWNGSVEAARAVTAALDLLRGMKKVRVLSIKEGRADPHPAEPLVHYLGWHGIPASVAEEASEGKPAERILAAVTSTLLGTATREESLMIVDGLQIAFRSTEDLLKLRDRYAQIVADEQAARSGCCGGNRRKVLVRFVPP